ncbi:hypothetical protein Syun_029747 [Stephania yunnanensis]|uniref:Uncharacterized protein n=1 Tax=Stephania yunnanensis TaxID=152371 RepID=A0AAP0EDS1_9MAGN
MSSLTNPSNSNPSTSGFMKQKSKRTWLGLRRETTKRGQRRCVAAEAGCNITGAPKLMGMGDIENGNEKIAIGRNLSRSDALIKWGLTMLASEPRWVIFVMLTKIILHRKSRAWLLKGLPLELMILYYRLPTTFGNTYRVISDTAVRVYHGSDVKPSVEMPENTGKSTQRYAYITVRTRNRASKRQKTRASAEQCMKCYLRFRLKLRVMKEGLKKHRPFLNCTNARCKSFKWNNYRSDPPDEKLHSAPLLSHRTYPPRDSWNFCLWIALGEIYQS